MRKRARTLTDDERVMLKIAGYSDTSIDYFLDQVNLGKIADPEIKHFQIGECGDLMFLFINLSEGVVIDEINLGTSDALLWLPRDRR